MRTSIRAGLVAALLTLPAPLPAFDVSAMSEAERTAFREEIRAYLLENPGILVEAMAVLEERREAEEAARDLTLVADNAQELFDGERSWTGGNIEGDVTIVEFIDYRCGFCQRAHPEVSELVASDGNIRLIVKEFPILGEQSVLASRFAIATRMLAGDDAYKAAHDALITMQGDVNELALELLAVQLGLDVPTVMSRMQDQAVTDIILANRELAQRLQIQGTPTFVFGDQMVRGYVPLAGMREIVAQERAEG